LIESLSCDGRSSHQYDAGGDGGQRRSATARLDRTVNGYDLGWLLTGQAFVEGGHEPLIGFGVAGTRRAKTDGRSHDVGILGISPKTLGSSPFNEGIDESR
jgi:hypothetical protein